MSMRRLMEIPVMIDCQVAGRIAAELAARQGSGRSVMVGQSNVYEWALK